MSLSGVGTCLHCGASRFSLSDTLSLQLDDGRMDCLPHPAGREMCEAKGLTLAQASERGRLFRETFFVCRHCGKEGETIDKAVFNDQPLTFSVRGAWKFGWGSAAVVIPLLAWMRWWTGVATLGTTLLAMPAIYWREKRKIARE
jgi:hypothetical protein